MKKHKQWLTRETLIAWGQIVLGCLIAAMQWALSKSEKKKKEAK